MSDSRLLPHADSAARRRSTCIGLLLLLAFALYANTLLNGFVYDDTEQLLQNPYVHSFRYLGKIFTTNVWSFQGEQGSSNYYRPLMTLGYLLCHQVFGDFPYGYHLINIFLHLAIVWLVFAVASEMFAAEAVAFLAGALFALHPIHTESVAWIAGVTDLELAFFYLLAFLLFLRLGDGSVGKTGWLRTGMHASFLLALLSKEQAMTLPIVAVAYEHFFRADHLWTTWRTKLYRYAGFWIVGAAYLLFRATLLGGVAMVLQHPDVSWPQAFLSALSLAGAYFGKLFYPWPLSPFYPFHKSVTLADPLVLAGAAVLFVAVAFFVLLWKKSRAHAFALLWIFLTLGPVLNARWMAASVFAERYLYLPSVGFCWLAAAAIVALWRLGGARLRLRRAVLAVTCAMVALAAAGVIITRNRDWRDDRTLFMRTLAVHPDASYIRTDLGTLEWRSGNRAEAEKQWRRALEDKPDNAIAFSNLGLAMLEKKRYDEALAFLASAIKLRPHFATPHIHRARVYFALARTGNAETEFLRAVEIYPFSPDARNALGRFYLDAGRLAEAEPQFRASVINAPAGDAFRGLGEIFAQQHNSAEAERAWRQVLVFEPFDSGAHFHIGALYLAAGRLAEAEKEYQAGLQTDPNNADALAALRKLAGASGPAKTQP